MRCDSTVKQLVGELDFSFHVVSTGDESETPEEEMLESAALFRRGTERARKRD
jgi:hypothetical protein